MAELTCIDALPSSRFCEYSLSCCDVQMLLWRIVLSAPPERRYAWPAAKPPEIKASAWKRTAVGAAECPERERSTLAPPSGRSNVHTFNELSEEPIEMSSGWPRTKYVERTPL